MKLYLTQDCNLRCDYCYLGEIPHKQMSSQTGRTAIDRLLDEVRRKRVGTVRVVFLGGEPLLRYSLLEELVLYAERQCREDGIEPFFQFTTNGTLLTTDKVSFFRLHNFIISLSLDGVRSAHDAHRRFADGRGSYEQVKRAARLLLDAETGLPSDRLTGRLTITPSTAHLLQRNVRHLLELGFTKIGAFPNYYDTEWSEEHLEELERQWRQIADLYMEMIENSESCQITPIHGLVLRRARRSSPGCGAGKDFENVAVGADGCLYPCSFVLERHSYRLGDVDSGFDAAAQDEIASFAYEENQSCYSCAVRSLCDGLRCRYANLLMTGDMCRPSGFFCAYSQMIIKISDPVYQLINQNPRHADLVDRSTFEFHPDLN